MKYYNQNSGVTIEVSEAVFEREYSEKGYSPVKESEETKTEPTQQKKVK